MKKRKRLEKKAIKGAKKAVKEFPNVFKRLKDEWKDVSTCCKAEIVDGRCDMCDGLPYIEFDPPEIQKEWNNYE